MAILSLQTILKDGYARPLYPQEGLVALLSQAPLAAKLASVHSERYASVLGGFTFSSCTCCNGCTTSSFSLDISAA